MRAENSVAYAEAATEPPDESRTGWRTALASTLGLACGPSVLAVTTFGAFIAPLHREFGWSIPAIGLASSLLSITLVLISPVQGLLVDRFGGRRVILCSSPFFALSLMAMYFLPDSLPAFYLGWVFIPLCGLGLWPVSYLRLTAGWFERRLGLALGVANSGIGIGTVLAPVLTTVLIGTWGWRAAYLGLGVVALIAFPVAYFLLAEPRPRTETRRVSGDTLRAAARTRPFWLVLAAFVLLGTIGSTVLVHQISLLLDAGIPSHIANLVPVALGVALIVARLVTGWLLDRFTVSHVMSVYLVGGIASVLLFAAGPNVPMALLAAALSGLLIGAEFDVLSYLIPRYFGRLAFGRIYGVAFAVFQIGGAAATSLVSVSRDRYGSYSPAMLVLAVACAVCAVLFLCLGPYRYDGASQVTMPEPVPLPTPNLAIVGDQPTKKGMEHHDGDASPA
ncbi:MULTISPECIES: MFS transporter [unclassified Streptomyces]|uniref:MFS transporter n=1 Tax=unclassified Streptomyces TaxID=2593676 RepID=UPI002DD7B71B|nr:MULTISPECIES: MFS transporter [unclassified Streptomyces]WRZ67900.1 MFS transporter [Streptomyces sp. NBC_01257]WSJ25793.1 MFS transporter [Streptomyces sp. NBC_01324]